MVHRTIGGSVITTEYALTVHPPAYLSPLDQEAGKLHALNIQSGESVGSVSVGSVSRFATPAAYGRNLYVPTMSGVTVVATS